MGKDLTGRTLGVIHAGTWVAATGLRFHELIMPEVQLAHICDDTLELAFRAAGVGKIPPYNYYRVATYARFLQDFGADVIMMGCSTMDRAVEHARPLTDVPILQIDRPMMDKAVQDGSRIGLLATLDTTIPSSTRLLEEAAKDAGREITIEQLFSAAAFAALRRGDQASHDEILLDIIKANQDKLDAIVMAQLSMAVLDERTHGKFRIPVYNSGREGWTRAREMLEALRSGCLSATNIPEGGSLRK